jgi:hypothetical protein
MTDPTIANIRSHLDLCAQSLQMAYTQLNMAEYKLRVLMGESIDSESLTTSPNRATPTTDAAPRT